MMAHLGVRAVRSASQRVLSARVPSEAKLHTLGGFASSLTIFLIYFGAVGFILTELGVSLTTYLASASVIGLAVSFGSQGMVQDVITGLTVVFSDLLDVGDMVEVGGKTGVVERVGMRFTVLVDHSDARVFIPNRQISSVVNFRGGSTAVFIDLRLPATPESWAAAEAAAKRSIEAAYEQHPGILRAPPRSLGRGETSAGYSFLRFRFDVWPGQGAVIEKALRAELIAAMRALDPNYLDWMVTVQHRAEPAPSRSPATRSAPAAPSPSEG